MPTNITGDPTVGISPSPNPPTPTSIPVVTAPVDLDLANAASVRQALTGPINEISWLKAPRAQASQWIQGVRSYMNARLQRRFGLDHMGLPAGKIVQWTEDWSDVGFVSHGANGSGTWAKRWLWGIGSSTSTGSLTIHGPGYTGAFRTMAMLVASSSPDSNVVFTRAQTGDIQVSDNVQCYLQWDAKFVSSTSSGHDYDIAMGFVDNTSTLGTLGAMLSLTAAGVYFVRRSGDANWQCVYTDGTSVFSVVDSGVAISTGKRFRVELHGSGVSDDSTSRLIWIIDGVIVRNVSVAGMSSTFAVPSFCSFFRGFGVVNAQTLGVGVVHFAGNIWPGDVFI